MSVVKNTLQENYIYFTRELVRVEEEMNHLPKGSISAKKIGKTTYYYQQWREGRKVKSISLGTAASVDLLKGIDRRHVLEKQKKEILENIRIIARAIDTQRVTAEEIIKIFSQHGIESVLIGSYCISAMKEELDIPLPNIKTQDIDFLVTLPYRGKEVDIESILKPMGFSIGFNQDGSTYFTNGVFKIEFLTPEKGEGSDKAIPVNPLKIRATPLRYLQMLSDHLIKIEKGDYCFFIPNPYVFAFHKMLIAEKRKTKDKKEKDLLQAVAVLRALRKNPESLKKAVAYLGTLPPKWKKYIREHINEYLPDFPTENGNEVIKSL
jgi:hypothetical protein